MKVFSLIFVLVCSLSYESWSARVVDGASEHATTYFLLEDGSLWSLGKGDSGQLGNGSTEKSSVPVKIIDADVVKIAAGWGCGFFIKKDGSLWGMGSNAGGRLGIGYSSNKPNPNPVMIVSSGVTDVAGGDQGANFFLKDDGSLWGMGPAANWFISSGSRESVATPLKVAENVKSFSVGGSHILYIKSSGELMSLGYKNSSGELGNGGTNYSIGVHYLIDSDVTSCSARYSSSAYIKADGSLYVFGGNGSGQLGDGGTSEFRSTPYEIASDGVVSVRTGSNTIFLKDDGKIYGMGYNQQGQLGIGTTENVWSPTVIRSSGVLKLCSAGGKNTLFVNDDGSLWASGQNNYGQLGSGIINSKVFTQIYPIQNNTGNESNNSTNSSTNSAEIKAYGIHAALLPATASHGGTIYFTSYDGASTWPLNDQNTVSSEFKPSSDGSSVFRADYMVGTASLGVYEHGAVSLNMPTADTDSNEVFDWLQKDMAVDATFSGSSEVHWLAPGASSANANITGRITRSAGSSFGTYTTTYSISGVTITAQGTWWVGYWSGTVSYEGSNYGVSITTTDSGGATRNLTGSATYSTSSESQLQFSDITLKEGSDELMIRGSTLNRSSSTYSAQFKAVDGGPNTSWSDFVDWHVVVTDTNDADSDGVPDFSDGDLKSTDSSSSEASSSSDDLSAKLDSSWAWFKYPWIYNASVESWCYLRATSDGHYLWCYKNSSWYSWDTTNAVWVKN